MILIAALLVVGFVLYEAWAASAGDQPSQPWVPSPFDPFDPNALAPAPPQYPGTPWIPGTAGCSADNPELCIPAPYQGDPMAAYIPGDPHTLPGVELDNQIIFALNAVAAAAAITLPAAAYVRFKAQMSVESGFVINIVGDPGNVPQYRDYGQGTAQDGSGNIVGTEGYCSLGLMQVNRCAHTQLGADPALDLMNGNDNIYAAAQIWIDAYQRAGGDLDLTTRNYNGSGPKTLLYLAKVKTVLGSWGAAA